MPRHTNEQTAAFVKLARDVFPGAETYPALSRLGQAEPSPVLVLVQASQLDPIQWPALAQSLEAGTPLLFWGRDPLQRLTNPPPALTLVSPSHVRYESPALRLHGPEEEAIEFKAPAQGPFMPAARFLDRHGVAARWVPLAETEDASGPGRAWPAALWVEARPGAPVRSWGWVGLDVSSATAREVGDLLRTAVRHLQAGYYVLADQPWPATHAGGSQLEIPVRVVSRHPRVDGLRISAELVEEGENRSVRRVGEPAREQVTLSLGTLPKVPRGCRDYRLRVALEQADGRLADELEAAVRVLPTGVPDSADHIGVTGSGFTLGRRPLFILGASLAVPAGWLQTGAPPASVLLDPEIFDAETMRRELGRAQEAGLNVLYARLEHARQLPALRWLVEELRERGLWLYLGVAGLDPVHPDLESARVLLEQARLAQDPVLFAVEAGSITRLGGETERAVWDEAWRAWLVDQYGSVEQAVEVLGDPDWYPAGQFSGPPDQALAGGAAPPAAVAAYRRFVADRISRELGAIRRLLNELGYRALVGARRTWGGDPATLPIDPAAGALHLDFMVVEDEGLDRDEAVRGAASRVAAYARGMMQGKPVVWWHAGRDVGPAPDAGVLAGQRDATLAMLDEVLRSHAAGLVVDRLPGGWSPASGADRGFTHPDGRWRPAGDLLRRFNLRVRREAAPPPSWTDVTVDPDSDPRGWYGWLVAGSGGAPAEEIRPARFNRSSLELAAAEGVTAEDEPARPAPSWLNAEWGVIRSTNEAVARAGAGIRIPRRMPLELEVWNSGAARWVNTQVRRPGSIWVRASQPALREVWLPVPDTAPGQRALVKWIPADAGAWELRLWSWEQGGFGELLRVKVQ